MPRKRKFPSDATASERSAASVAAHKAAGGQILNIRLSADASAKLRVLIMREGWPATLTGVVHRLIDEAI